MLTSNYVDNYGVVLYGLASNILTNFILRPIYLILIDYTYRPKYINSILGNTYTNSNNISLYLQHSESRRMGKDHFMGRKNKTAVHNALGAT